MSSIWVPFGIQCLSKYVPVDGLYLVLHRGASRPWDEEAAL